MTAIVNTTRELAALITNGSQLCLAPDYSGCAMSVVLELVRQKVRNLRLVAVPQMGLQADWLIGAGCVTEIDGASVTLGEFGQAPRFVKAFTQRSITMRDSTCPVIHAGLQAAEKGIPFMPLRGILDSDLLKHRPDWQTIDNPFAASEDPILLVPAITPSHALFHVPLADQYGNVWIGTRREMMLMAHASRKVLVSTEKLCTENLLDNPELAPGVIPSLYISAIAEVPRGADPIGLFGCYEADESALANYAKLAKTDEGFDEFLRQALND
ncbi:MAG: CoA synthetase [Gammaproteobacteria bacterium]|nr:CoA synthetase [Gammaproteobacteria bacterium]